MGASLEIPKGLKTLLPASADARYLNEDDQPYVDLQQAYNQNPEGARTLGLTVNVDKTEYWWKDGLTNAHLVPKTSGIEFTTDESLYLDPVSHILRANLTTHVQTFDYISGPQVFTLLERPVRILYIWVQGVGIIKPSQRDINVSAKTITINDELDSGDIVTVCYSYVITEAIHPFITAAQVEDMLEGIDADPIMHTGDVTGEVELTIANKAVTNNKLANVPSLTVKGRSTLR